MHWEASGKISNLKNNFLQESLLLQPRDSNNLLLHPSSNGLFTVSVGHATPPHRFVGLMNCMPM